MSPVLIIVIGGIIVVALIFWILFGDWGDKEQKTEQNDDKFV